MLEALANIRRMLGDIETTDDETCRMELCRRVRIELAKLDSASKLLSVAKALLYGVCIQNEYVVRIDDGSNKSYSAPIGLISELRSVVKEVEGSEK